MGSCSPPTRRWRCVVGYLLGSIPFGLLLTQAAGPRRRAQHRLRQHRRHQRAAHRAQGAGRRHAAARPAQGHGRGAARRRDRQALRAPSTPSSCAYVGGPRRLPRPHLSGLAALSRAARASRPTSACCSACTGRRRSCSAWCGLAVAAATRYSSLAALAGTRRRRALLPASRARLACCSSSSWPLLIFCKHHANIRRLLAGEESKIGADRRPEARRRGLRPRRCRRRRSTPPSGWPACA